MSKYEIKIDKFKCVGSTLCVMDAPEVFALNGEMQSHVIDANAADDEAILHAAQSCPMNAIILIDRETGQKAWPAR
ncbi:MAG: ferredoxin [bacterium]|nr:ferredoxin [bacterium]